jgi:hypothetical protein
MNDAAEHSRSGNVEVERVVAAARDALTDEMVSRMSATAADAMDLVDQVQRSGLARAIPALVQLVENGDLQRLVRLARVYSSAEDALTEEMVGRMADTMGNGLSLLDRLSRGGGERIVAMLERLENSGALEKLAETLPRMLARLDQVHDMLECVERAAVASGQSPRSAGGAGGLWRIVKDSEAQDTVAFLMLAGKNLRASCGKGGTGR